MSKNQLLLECTNELYEIRNTLGYLKRSFNVENKTPISLSTVPNCSRVLGSFKQRATDFFYTHRQLGIYATGYLTATDGIIHAFGNFAKKFNLDEEEGVMTSEQKKALVTWVQQIDRRLLTAAGLLYYSLEKSDALNELDPDVRDFIVQAKEVYDEEEANDDATEERMAALGLDDPDELEEIDEDADASVDALIEAQTRSNKSSTKPSKNPKTTISPEIDK